MQVLWVCSGGDIKTENFLGWVRGLSIARGHISKVKTLWETSGWVSSLLFALHSAVCCRWNWYSIRLDFWLQRKKREKQDVHIWTFAIKVSEKAITRNKFSGIWNRIPSIISPCFLFNFCFLFFPSCVLYFANPIQNPKPWRISCFSSMVVKWGLSSALSNRNTKYLWL